MSGSNYDITCPNCNGELQVYSDHKPFDHSHGACVDCGFCYYTKTGQLSLKKLNEFREDILEMEPLKRRRVPNLDSDLKW